MRTKYVFGILALTALMISSCGKKTGGCPGGEKAIVKDFSEESDSCGIVIQLEDGTKLEATNLIEFQNIDFSHGTLLWVSYRDVSGTSLCGLGEIVELKCVSEREY